MNTFLVQPGTEGVVVPQTRVVELGRVLRERLAALRRPRPAMTHDALVLHLRNERTRDVLRLERDLSGVGIGRPVL
ncbi:hypothetical protein AAIB33_08005 [Microbacterium sp. AZCO]|uniref:hypothetical protein n=1 Tax=Microbacterium sp. AZCO TaxID=3142976 RepID=UPI0031F3497E